MIKAITNNPFRVLGVYVDATESDIKAAAERLYLHPEQKCDTDFSIPDLPVPSRDYTSISSALRIALDESVAAGYKMFWFAKPKDETGLGMLSSGNLEGASQEWAALEEEIPKHNFMVCCLLGERYPEVAHVACELMEMSSYRFSLLRTALSSDALLTGFKALLYNENNADVVFQHTSLIQDKIFNGLAAKVQAYSGDMGSSHVVMGRETSYWTNLSTIDSCKADLRALQLFTDNSTSEYVSLMQGLSDSILQWIELVLRFSLDSQKFQKVQPIAALFGQLSPEKNQASYLDFLGCILKQDTEGNPSNDIIFKMFFVASDAYGQCVREKMSPEKYDKFLEQRCAKTLPFVREQLGQDNEQYVRLINFLADIGGSIVESYTKDKTAEGLFACRSILFRIDELLDYSLLNENFRSIVIQYTERMKRLKLVDFDDGYYRLTTTPALIELLPSRSQYMLSEAVIKAVSGLNDSDNLKAKFEQYVVNGKLERVHEPIIRKMFSMCFSGNTILVERAKSLAALDQNKTIYGAFLNGIFHDFEPQLISRYNTGVADAKDKQITENALSFIKNADSVESLLVIHDFLGGFVPEVSEAARSQATSLCISGGVVDQGKAERVINNFGHQSIYKKRLCRRHFYSIVLSLVIHTILVFGSIWLLKQDYFWLLNIIAVVIILGSGLAAVQLVFKLFPAIANFFSKGIYHFDQTMFVWTKGSAGAGRFKAVRPPKN